MSRSTRWFLTVALAGTLVVVAGIGATAAAVYGAGSIAVDVQNSGTDLSLTLPAALADVAIALAPSSLLRDAAVEIEPLLPAARAAWTELRDTPDFVLVEIESDGERLRVEKRGGRFEVRIVADGADFRIGVPLRLVGAVLAKLDRAA